MPSLTYLLLLITLTTLTTLVTADQWYMPDSNLISDQEFNSKIVEDKLSFKFVKYFTPHCPYCRYLKAVFDQLKHKKQWCFKVYDFNCQWYPQFCMNHVKSGSFPYTAIHDQQGNMIEEIHGFYPSPIITTIFDRIEERCLAARGLPVPSSNQHETGVPQVAHHELIIANNIPQPAAVDPVEYHQQPKVEQEKPTTQIKTDTNMHSESHPQEHSQTNIEEKPKTQQVKVQQQHTTTTQHSVEQSSHKRIQQTKQVQSRTLNEKHINNVQQKQNQTAHTFHNYLFYGVCFLCAGYYVYTLHSNKSNPQVHSNITTKTSDQVSSNGQHNNTFQSKQKQHVDSPPCMQQSELLEHIPDQEL